MRKVKAETYLTLLFWWVQRQWNKLCLLSASQCYSLHHTLIFISERWLGRVGTIGGRPLSSTLRKGEITSTYWSTESQRESQMRFLWDERQFADNEVPSLTSSQNKKGKHKGRRTHCLTYTHTVKETRPINKHPPLSSGYRLLHTNPSQIPLESNETGTVTPPCVRVRVHKRVCVCGIKRQSDHAECKSQSWVFTIPEVVLVCWNSVPQTPGNQQQ